MPKHASQIIGSFVFRNEGNGCLTSKFQHEDSRECPFTEASKLIGNPHPADRFIGVYRTVWLEDNDRHVPAELIIERHPDNAELYRLTWLSIGTPADTLFWGCGMLYGDLLVGAYWD